MTVTPTELAPPTRDPLVDQLVRDRDGAVKAARALAKNGVQGFTDSASFEGHLDAAERAQSRLDLMRVREPLVYEPGAPQSFFRDLAMSGYQGDTEARARLGRHAEQMIVELPRLKRARQNDLNRRGGLLGVEMQTRALSTSTGAGGEFTLPLWLIDRWASVPRAAAPLASECTSLPLPEGVSSVSVPLFTANTGTAVQPSNNTLLNDFGGSTTSYVTSGVTTIAGAATVAEQLLQFTPPDAAHFDEVVASDLASSWYEQLEAQLINGSGASGQLRGLLNTSGITSSAYTSATPTGAAFLTALAQTSSLTSTARKRMVTMCLLHPRRWFWLAGQLDSSGRPLISPANGEFLDAGDAGPFGPLLGMLPAYATTAVPTTVSTNQDPVIVTRPVDHLLLTSIPSLVVSPETHADSVGLTFALTGFASFLGARYPTATGVLTGTGLAAPAGF